MSCCAEGFSDILHLRLETRPLSKPNAQFASVEARSGATDGRMCQSSFLHTITTSDSPSLRRPGMTIGLCASGLGVVAVVTVEFGRSRCGAKSCKLCDGLLIRCAVPHFLLLKAHRICPPRNYPLLAPLSPVSPPPPARPGLYG